MSNRPQPVLTANVVAGVLTSVAAVAGTLGFTSAQTRLSGSAQALAAVIVAAVVLVSHVLAALHARQAVTPIADPHDGTGAPLIPTARSWGPILHSTPLVSTQADPLPEPAEAQDGPPEGDVWAEPYRAVGPIVTGSTAAGPYPASFGQVRDSGLIESAMQSLPDGGES